MLQFESGPGEEAGRRGVYLDRLREMRDALREEEAAVARGDLARVSEMLGCEWKMVRELDDTHASLTREEVPYALALLGEMSHMREQNQGMIRKMMDAATDELSHIRQGRETLHGYNGDHARRKVMYVDDLI